jgi:hypothetical protein
MKAFNVEGFYISAKILKKSGDSQKRLEAVEFFRKVVWANDAKEAMNEASRMLNGGKWKELPKISDVTEEKKMRKLNAPELPGMSKADKKRR